jgi:tetratricopeptide (TPR) repeat protein
VKCGNCFRWAASVAVLAGVTGCGGGTPVTRIVDGRAEAGRAVDEEAYAASLRAGIFDATGDRDRALDELERALAADPESPELLARYGSVACGAERSSPPRPASALSAFSRALALDPTYAPAWLGRARCLELLGREPEALAAAELAAAYDPEHVGATELVARLLFAFGRKTEAWSWLDGLATLAPESPEAQRALLSAAVRLRDREREQRARRALAALGVRLPGDAVQELERAIVRGDLPAARRAAISLHVPSGTLAVLLARRAPELALSEGEAVLRADPSASDAWIAALAAADVLGARERFAALLPLLDANPLPPSRAALALLGELVQRHAGDDASRAFARALGDTETRADASDRDTERRP